MPTSEECNDAWSRGYIDGYAEHKSTTPSIPSRPASFPPGEDPLAYFYKHGRDQGRIAALQSLAGISKNTAGSDTNA